MSVETLPPPTEHLEQAVIADQLEAQWAEQQANEAREAAALQDFMDMTQPAVSGEAPADAPIGAQVESEHAALNEFMDMTQHAVSGEAPAFDVASTEFKPWYDHSPTADAPTPVVVEAPVEAPAPNPWFTPASERAAVPDLIDLADLGDYPVHPDNMPANGEYRLAPDAAIIPNFVTAEGTPVAEPTPPAPAPRDGVYGTPRPEIEAPIAPEPPRETFVQGAGMPYTEADRLRDEGRPVPASVQARSQQIKIAYATQERANKEANYLRKGDLADVAEMVGVSETAEARAAEVAAAELQALRDGGRRHGAPERERFRHGAPRRALGNLAMSTLVNVRNAINNKITEKAAAWNARNRTPEAPATPPAVPIPEAAQVTNHRRTRKNKSSGNNRGGVRRHR